MSEGEKSTVVIGRVCWSLMSETVGEEVRVSRYDAYQMGVSYAPDQRQGERRIESLGHK